MLLHLTLIQTTSNYIQILIASALVFRLSNLVQLLERLLFKRSFLPVSGSDLMLSWSRATLLSSWMWRRSMSGRNFQIQGRRGWRTTLLSSWMWRRSMSGRNFQIQGRRDEEQPCFHLGCEEGRCPAETSGSKAVVMKNNLAFILDVKKVDVRPKLPDPRPSWWRTTLLSSWMWRGPMSGQNCWILLH